MHFIPSIAISTGTHEKALSLSIHIAEQEKKKYDLSIESVASYVNMFTSYDLLLAEKVLYGPYSQRIRVP